MLGLEKSGRTLILYLVCSSLLFFLDLRGFLTPIHNLVQALTIPLDTRLFKTKKSIAPNVFLVSSGELEKKAEEAEVRNAFLSSQLAKLGSLEKENARLRKLLGASLPPSWMFELANVVSSSGDILQVTSDYTPSSNTAVITTDDKVKQGGVFVGFTEEKVGRKIKIILPTSDLSKIPVVVRDKNNGQLTAVGLALGRGGKVILDQVLTKETLKKGDLILTNEDGAFPAGLLLGVITRVLPVKDGAWQQAEMELATNVNALDTVFFVTKY
ncbi:MAG: rod shape-determining protein MreC [Candidatus Blackburnbacteria bacterium]|nr:rod shape-determining protein MreC [Candidatus Blackburnbacteria bacterium]